jgi:hypothetical protein
MHINVKIFYYIIILNLLEPSIFLLVLLLKVIFEIKTPESEYFNKIILFDPKGVHYAKGIQKDEIDAKRDNY